MNNIYKIFLMGFSFSLLSCNTTSSNSPSISSSQNESVFDSTNISSSTSNISQTNQENTSTQDNSKIVIYFSCTNNTERIATYISEIESIELKEIVPTNPYTSDDLNYSNSSCRANQEQSDDSARPEYETFNFSFELYSHIYLGYPIWWGKLPKIIYTFLEDYDFSNKTIIPFCASGGSGIVTSVNEIKNLESNATVLDGRRFSSGSSKDDVSNWVNSIN